MPDYRRYRIPGGTYFFTVNLLERHPNDLLIRPIDVLRQAVKETRKRWPFHIDSWGVLPDHLHYIWIERGTGFVTHTKRLQVK